MGWQEYNGMDMGVISSWRERLERLGGRTVGAGAMTAAELDAFCDEAGNRRRVDRPLLCWRYGVAAGPTPAGVRDEEALWWALHDPTIDVDALLAPESNLNARGVEMMPPLLARAAGTIEVFTESQLSSLHALWHLAGVRNRPDYRERCLRVASWFIEHIQPDNATNHAWAIHVFVALGASGATPQAGSAISYGATLLHNCRVQLGVPDRFSRELIGDAAEALRNESLRLTNPTA